MFELLVVLAIYSVIILFFVPLERIGKVQNQVRKNIQRFIDRTKD